MSSFVEFSVSTQSIFLLVRSFIDPTFCGIFVCGPLQFKGREVACVESVSVWFQSKIACVAWRFCLGAQSNKARRSRLRHSVVLRQNRHSTQARAKKD